MVPARLSYVNALAQKFCDATEELDKAYSSAGVLLLCKHLSLMLKTARATAAGDKEAWKELAEADSALAESMGSQLKLYRAIGFEKFFHFDIVLVQKNIVTSEAFNAMSGPEQGFSKDEIEMFLRQCENLISLKLTFTAQRIPGTDSTNYLAANEEQDLPFTGSVIPVNDSQENDNEGDQRDSSITKARQLLAIHYFLKAALGIEGRDSNSVSGIARFIHLMTGTRFTTLQNSDIYKKYLQMPNYKKDGALIADLRFIRPYFETLGLESALKLIDEETARAIHELPFGERSKYGQP